MHPAAATSVTEAEIQPVEALGSVSINGTIIANGISNDPTTPSPDCRGTFTSTAGFNLIETVSADCTIGGKSTGNITGVDPNLGALALNGATTQTHALLSTQAYRPGHRRDPGS